MVAILRDYVHLYQLRNLGHGRLEPRLENEWKELSFTIESVFSGMYRDSIKELGPSRHTPSPDLRRELPLESLRVPVETVICDVGCCRFAARLCDLSIGGAYLHSPVPLAEHTRVSLIFPGRDLLPIEVEGRVAWTNHAGRRKPRLAEGSGVHFLGLRDDTRMRISEYVYDIVEETIASAHLT
jgi:hypothetical protein